MAQYSDVIQRFLRYVKIDTQSSEESGTHPSTEKQKNLGRLLYKELKELGAQDVVYDEEHNYVYGKIPATDGGKSKKVLGFIAHMDTSPETSGAGVNPQIHEAYDGKDIVLSKEENIVLSPAVFPELLHYVGKTLITTDGTTLLGADDKAGVSEIMSMSQCLLRDAQSDQPAYIHGTIAIAFTSDEEIGEGVEFFDQEQFGADYAYTVDGGGIGELEYENFNAAAAIVKVHGVTVHPGEAKGKMKNAARIATEFQNALPAHEIPEETELYEGFCHLLSMSGDTESAKLQYIIRDHHRDLFQEKKERMVTIAKQLNAKYGAGTVELELKDQYYNMREKIEPEYLFLIDQAAEAMRRHGVTPITNPIRGGTDGAMLSFRGLPCPNLCTGGHNYHGRYEYACLESMEQITEILIDIACHGDES